MENRVGVEPTTNGLKVRDSTTELPVRKFDFGSLFSDRPLWWEIEANETRKSVNDDAKIAAIVE